MENILNSEVIAKFDKSDMFPLIKDFPRQWEEAVSLVDATSFVAQHMEHNYNKIVITGLGGSAMGGDVLRSCLGEEKGVPPIFVNRNYTLPAFVDEDTLLIAISYSGNTEETLSACQKGFECSAQVIAITSGGKLKELAEEKGAPVISVPSGFPPRTALGYLFLPALLLILEKFGLTSNKKKEIEETKLLLQKLSERYAALSEDNLAVNLAREMLGKLPLIYSSELLGVAGFRWKTQINENSKSLAFPVLFPELNHNEIVGWEGMKDLGKKLQLIILRDEKDHERIKKRIEITKGIIGKLPGGIKEVYSEGESLLARLFSLIYLGDWVSFYLAVLGEVDPTPVKPIDLLKKQLANQ